MKLGQVQLVGMMIFFAVFVMMMAIAPALKEQVASSRVSLDCSNASLSAGEAGTCIAVDSMFFLFVGVSLMVGLGWIGAKRLNLIGGS